MIDLDGYKVSFDQEKGCVRVEGDGRAMYREVVDELEALGVRLAEDGRSATSISHRMRAATPNFAERGQHLMNEDTSFKKRWRLLHQTVATSLLFGAGGWAWSRDLGARLQRFELRHMRLMLRLVKGEEESWPGFFKRSAAVGRTLSEEEGLPSLLQRAPLLKHPWTGHCARAVDSPVHAAVVHKDAVCWRGVQKKNGDNGTHRRSGGTLGRSTRSPPRDGLEGAGRGPMTPL